jgi:hypothetical protein
MYESKLIPLDVFVVPSMIRPEYFTVALDVQEDHAEDDPMGEALTFWHVCEN